MKPQIRSSVLLAVPGKRKSRPALRNCCVLFIGALAVVGGQNVLGADLYWDGGTQNWSNTNHWSTSSSDATQNPSSHPGSADIAYFSIDGQTTADVDLTANESALGVVVRASATGTTLVHSNNGALKTLTIGGSGILVNSGAGAVTFGDLAKPMDVVMAAAQSWTNDSSSSMTVVNNVTNGGFLLTSSGTGNTAINGAVGGIGGLTKTGNGTLTLSASNGYSGSTTVSGGTLTLTGAGSIANSPLITLAATTGLNVSGVTATPWTVGAIQTLAGEGTVTGATTINGNHQPGGTGTVGTQTFTGGTLTYGSASIFNWDIDINGASEVGHDTVNTGTLAGSSAVFNVVLGSGDAFADAFWDIDRSWNDIFSSGTLASVFSSITGTGITWDPGTLRGNVTGRTGFFTASGNTLNYTAIPEPTSALAGLLLVVGLLRRRRA